MASPFSRTLRSLRSERSKSSFVGLAALAVLLGLWLTWFLSARLPVYALSEEARLEVERAVHPVAALAAGRIVEARAAVGQEVEPGDVLFELDSELERRRLDEEIARRQAMLKEIESLQVALVTESQGLADTRNTRAAVDEARSRYRAAVAAAELAAEEAARRARLKEQGLISEMELRRAEAQAREHRAQAEASEQAVARLAGERRVEGRDRQVRIDQLEREIAELEGSAETSAAAARRLEEEISRRLIRAPAAGRLGEVAKVRAGSVVAAGDHLATVIPTAELKVVAGFPPSDALARGAPGAARRAPPRRLSVDRARQLAGGGVEGGGRSPRRQAVGRLRGQSRGELRDPPAARHAGNPDSRGRARLARRAGAAGGRPCGGGGRRPPPARWMKGAG